MALVGGGRPTIFPTTCDLRTENLQFPSYLYWGLPMGYRNNNRGSLVIDRLFGELGRLKRSSGTQDKKVYDQLNLMLDNLRDNNRKDILTALINGTLTLLDVYDKWRRHELKNLAVVEAMIPMHDAITQYIKTSNLAEPTKRGYLNCANQLHKINPTASILDIPSVLQEYRKVCSDNDTVRSFNQARAVCQSYLNNTYGKHHQLWTAVSSVKTVKGTKQRKGMARNYADVYTMINTEPDIYTRMFWTMCITGMGINELYGAWEIESDKIVIHGTKRKSRERIVPRFDISLVKEEYPTVKYLRAAIHKRNPTWVLYDGRRSFAHWLDMAGVPKIRIQAYMGHSIGTVTDLYLQHEVTNYLTSDAALLQTYFKENRPKVNPVLSEFFTYNT